MDNNDSPNFQVTDAHALPSSPFPEADPLFSRDRSKPTAPGIKSRGVLRRLVGRWWQLLLLSLLVSAPIVFSINKFIEPTYEASSLLKIEPVDPQVFSTLRSGDSQTSTYLKTQVTVLTSDNVLEPTIANALVSNLPMIKKSEDPKNDIRQELKVAIIEGTHVIRVALELPNRDDAITIVAALTQAYQSQATTLTRSANRNLTLSMTQELEKLKEQIDLKRSKLKDLYQEGKVAAFEPRALLSAETEADPTQPILSRVAEDQYAKLIDRLAQCDFDCLEAQSHLEAAKSVRARNQNKIDEETLTRTAVEFKKDPRVVALADELDESRKLADSKVQPPPAAVLAAREKLKKLSNEYEELWASEYPGIRIRLDDGNRSILSDAKIRELEVVAETARRKRTAYAKQLEKINVVKKPGSGDTFEAVCLNYQLNSLLHREEIVENHRAQLMFEDSREHFRVIPIDAASAPKSPSNDSRLRYMAAAPVYVFFLLLGLFLVQEIMAGRSPEMRYVRKPG